MQLNATPPPEQANPLETRVAALEARLTALERQNATLAETVRLLSNSASLTAEWLYQVRDHLESLLFRQDVELQQWRDFYKALVKELGIGQEPDPKASAPAAQGDPPHHKYDVRLDYFREATDDDR